MYLQNFWFSLLLPMFLFPTIFSKLYQRCELARDLLYRYRMSRQHVEKMVCIAHYESGLSTSAIGRMNGDGSADHGLFQISDKYWCSNNGIGKACNMDCRRLRDDYIADDLWCANKIMHEHSGGGRLDGFTAWAVYGRCNSGKSTRFLRGCF